MMIYLDHTSTSRLYPEVAQYIKDNIDVHFANPASAHSLGLREERLIKDGLSTIAKTLSCLPNELIVTSGASESINTAIFSTARKNKHNKTRIITTKGDHEATLNAFKALKQEGFDTIELPLTATGVLDLDALKDALNPETSLISVIAVNNETGAINDIEAIVSIRDSYAPQALIHVDFVQAWTKIPIHLKRLKIDFASFSGHKIHGPKGIGLLYVRGKTSLSPLIYGGGQQKGRRSGTENPVMVQALALAAELGTSRLVESFQTVTNLRTVLLEALADIPYLINSPDEGVPHILNLSFVPVRGETILHILANKDIYCSTTSACSSAKNARSHVLTAMGFDAERIDAGLRISLASENTVEEIKTTAAAIVDAYHILAAIGGKR